MDLDLTGKHALVCGGSEGIGRAAAHELALLGAAVTVLARREPALRAVVDALPVAHDGQQYGWCVADVADTAGLQASLQQLLVQRPVDILVNNTGGPPGGSAHEAAVDAYLDAFRRHLVAGQTLVQAVLPHMRERRWGRIVNVVSTSVREPIAGLGVSNTVRGAVAGWAKTLSRELAADGITVNNVLPGFTETGRIDQIVRDRAAREGRAEADIRADMAAGVPARRFARPEETGGVIAFLCSPAAAYVNGVSLAVDGGRMASI
ncbi:SDR family NAD(P)-dependent oxidoreductase [Luteimonas sp. MHLX1A]|uniref:SDR family NAD(P)-dependent oxidoreductase n=1 Tax=Alterluteimonas muca TaxID=2878684 RepID=UPI001E46AA8A|nr:SDR family NAD(P)-dependent oxidoreductase [Luteimonas sp. MHLX1A]MCD9046679.1 SDR family oxidoreductase [Luteimonas sp. MHLX1A]